MSTTVSDARSQTHDAPSRRLSLPHLNVKTAALGAVAVAVAVIVFGLQSYNVGFWSPGHGWTSVHALALWTHATPETGFVAYSQSTRLSDGSVVYDYFDRYPPFFSAMMRPLLLITDHLPTEIMIFRHLMNGIFLGMMAVSYLLVRLWVDNRFLAAAITVLAFSSFALVNYKDMIHYDQPALLLLLLLTYTIARYRLGDWRQRRVWWVALLAVSIGRGYASFFVLALWVMLEAVECWLAPRDVYASVGGRLTAPLRLPALWISVAAVMWAALWLGYNIQAEARTRNVPLTETSIVDSAMRRLPFVGNAIAEGEHRHSSDKGLQGWAAFAAVQTERVVVFSLPVRLGGVMNWRFVPLEDPLEINWLRLGTGSAMIAGAVVFAVRTRPGLRYPAVLLAFGGMFWLYFMINLSTKHDYVTMYSVGLPLVVYTALFGRLGNRRLLVGLLVVGALGAFTAANLMARQYMTDEIDFAQQYTYDFDRIRRVIDGSDNTLFMDYDYKKPECIINQHICFAPGYYFDQNHMTNDLRQAEYVLSERPYYLPQRFTLPGGTAQLIYTPLTPANRVAFLMDVNAMQSRELPAAPEPIVYYGDGLTLQSWTLHGEVRLSACEHVVIESWWLAEQQPDDNLNMQIVMVDASGQMVTESNNPLGRVPTSIWPTGHYTAEARPLVVPCDTPPGEYPLIMGVYNPDTLETLPVQATDGAALGNQWYLTSLFVE